MLNGAGEAGRVGLERVDSRNRQAVEALSVAAGQRAYLTTPSLAEFLAEAHLHPTFEQFAIVAGGEVVGCVSLGHLPEQPEAAWIPLLIIDWHQQRRGFGRAAMNAVINLLSADSQGFSGVGLSCHPANEVAMRLYESLGFTPTGTVEPNGEIVLRLALAAGYSNAPSASSSTNSSSSRPTSSR